MTLIIGATPYSQWQILTPLLEHLGWSEKQSADVETWYQSGSKTPDDAKFVLLHSRPELALASALEADIDVELAFKAWNLAADKMLAFYQRNRQRAVLVDTVAASESPDALVDWLANNHGAFSSRVSSSKLPALPPNSIVAPPSTLLMVASQYVNGVVGLEAKLERLEAMSAPLSDQGYVAPELRISDVLQELEEARNVNASLHTQRDELEQRIALMEKNERAEASEHKKQVELLELLLHQTQEELSDLIRERNVPPVASDAEHQLEKTREELARVTEKLKITETTFTKDLDNAKAENELLILQLHQVQEEMEDLHFDSSKFKEELNQCQIKLTKANEALELARGKVSELEELSARTQRELDSTRGKVSELEEASARTQSELDSTRGEVLKLKDQQQVTKEHLARTQSDLQVYHSRASQFEKDSSKKQDTIKQLQSSISDKNQKLQKLSKSKKQALHQVTQLQRTVKEAEHQQHILNTELTQLKKSITWRLGSPVRALSDVAKIAHKPSRQKKALSQQASLLEDTHLFDPGWYLDRYPDVASTPISPAEHYLAHGATEGRDPSEHFSTEWYLKKYQDVAQSGMNPLLHYLLYGQAEGRKPAPNAKA